jgi:hypothetical protein
MFRCLLLIVWLAGTVHPAVAGDRYFPEGSLSNNAESDKFREEWYAKCLRAMSELPLSDQVIGQHVYRLTWLRTFHHPMIFRLEFAKNGTAELHVKVTSGAGGYDPGVMTVNKTVPLSKTQTETILAGLEQIKFWAMASHFESFGADGAQWIVEGVKDTQYHVVDRWSPDGSAFQFWALAVMELGGVNLEPVY